MRQCELFARTLPPAGGEGEERLPAGGGGASLGALGRRRHTLGRTVLGAGAWEAMEDMVSTPCELSL